MSPCHRQLVLLLSLVVAGCGGGGDPSSPPGPAPVASVAVTVASGTVQVGGGTQATAVLHDASGGVLTGRAVTWTSSNGAIASVASDGSVTALSQGVASIIASSEGRSGSAPVAVTLPPVATVSIQGTARIKVGDSYTYTAQARLADGTLVVRPVTWSVVEAGKATITPNGVLTPLATGSITVRASVEAVSFNGALTAYDWTFGSNGATIGAFLVADTPISNKFGTSEFPTLGIGCSSGTFVVYVGTDNFVTQNGNVAFSFDGGTAIAQTWVEFDAFSSLAHPGPTNLATKNLAVTIGGSRTFAFAFTEFQSSARATLFRVTGLTPLLNQILGACPSNAIMAEPDGTTALERLAPFLRPVPMTPERVARVAAGASNSPTPATALQGIQTRAPVRLSRP